MCMSDYRNDTQINRCQIQINMAFPCQIVYNLDLMPLKGEQ